MRLAVIGSPSVPVPPPAYGGTELVLDGLLRGLVTAGHEVAYAGHPQSTVPVELLPAAEAAHRRPIGDVAAELAHVLIAYERAVEWGADVIHDHSLLGPLSARVTTPIVVTSHGPFDRLTTPIFERIARRAAVVAISQSQAASAPSVPVTAVVHHGLDVGSFPFGQGDAGHLLFLGRMHPDKGPDRAVRLAARAGVPLVLAAKMREPVEIEFFEECVKPLLHSDAHFIGEADASTKRELLGGARALINPIRWAEPFGMVMVEALACGTPVISTPYGAATEIVEHGTTGFLCATDTEFVDGIARVGTLERSRCRASVASRFTIDRMVAGYERVFEQVLAASATALITHGDRDPRRPALPIRRTHQPVVRTSAGKLSG